jgi:hypothetical protein
MEERINLRAERLRHRQESITKLKELVALAELAAPDLGLEPHPVKRTLEQCKRAAERLTKWEEGLRPLTGDSDDRAEMQFVELSEQVWAALQAVERMVARTRGTGKVGKRARRRMTVDQANKEAMKLANRRGADFVRLSQREQAKLIGCSWATWKKTPFFEATQKRRHKISSRASRTRTTGKRPTSLTKKVEEAAVEGGKDQVLNDLIAEQGADYEPSPLSDGLRRVFIRKQL